MYIITSKDRAHSCDYFEISPGHQSDAYILNVSTCSLEAAGSIDTVEFYTCDGGTDCNIDTAREDARSAATFEEIGV